MIDSINIIKGVDTVTQRLALPKTLVSDSVNRSYRGGKNQPRPRFRYINHSFDSQLTESTLRFGNVSGVFGYNKFGLHRQPHVIVAVADSIIAGRIYGNSINWKTIFRGIQAVWLKSYFVQAEEILVFQNGKDLPLYWDGISNQMAYCKDAPGIANAMPIGNIMVYAHGRIFVCTEENLVFSSNHVNSNLLVGNLAALNFAETLYFTDGDGFGAPASMGNISGANVVGNLGDKNAHGPIIIFCDRGAFIIDPRKDRNQWLGDPDIQTIGLVGRGAVSAFSVIQVNSDLWYRCPDLSIASYKHGVYVLTEKWNNTSLSLEVDKYLKYDNGNTAQFSHAAYFDNRIIFSVAHRTKANSVDEWGFHRFALGLVVSDLSEGTLANKDDALTWDGLWTGIRSTGSAKVNEGNEERLFFMSFDKDEENRLYELMPSIGNDVGPGGEVQPESMYVNPNVLSGLTSDGGLFFAQKKIDSSIMFLSDIQGKTQVNQFCANDDNPCWKQFSQSTENVGYDCTEFNQEECGAQVYSPCSDQIIFEPCPSAVGNFNNSGDVGRIFSIKTTIKGLATPTENIFFSTDTAISKSQYAKSPKCKTEPVICCPDEYFNYLIWPKTQKA